MLPSPWLTCLLPFPQFFRGRLSSLISPLHSSTASLRLFAPLLRLVSKLTSTSLLSPPLNPGSLRCTNIQHIGTYSYYYSLSYSIQLVSYSQFPPFTPSYPLPLSSSPSPSLPLPPFLLLLCTKYILYILFFITRRHPTGSGVRVSFKLRGHPRNYSIPYRLLEYSTVNLQKNSPLSTPHSPLPLGNCLTTTIRTIFSCRTWLYLPLAVGKHHPAAVSSIPSLDCMRVYTIPYINKTENLVSRNLCAQLL